MEQHFRQGRPHFRKYRKENRTSLSQEKVLKQVDLSSLRWSAILDCFDREPVRLAPIFRSYSMKSPVGTKVLQIESTLHGEQ
jgi:hypothetical protein